jgi:hypothetical protein
MVRAQQVTCLAEATRTGSAARSGAGRPGKSDPMEAVVTEAAVARPARDVMHGPVVTIG